MLPIAPTKLLFIIIQLRMLRTNGQIPTIKAFMPRSKRAVTIKDALPRGFSMAVLEQNDLWQTLCGSKI